MFFPGYGYPGNSFEQTYRCYPASFIDKPQLESGDKIIMPPSALDRLASLHIEYPMLFELHNIGASRSSHCGVLEFIAEEGIIYMPYWMMQNLLLMEGDVVHLKNATLPKGTYVKLQPHTKDFLDISNSEDILETTLRSFSCLTTGDNIMAAYNNKKYYVDIVETKPSSAISIIETDCEVDFAPPLDYIKSLRECNRRNRLFLQAKCLHKGSSSRQTSGKLQFGSNANAPKAQPKVAGKETKEEPPKSEEPKFQAFTGKYSEE